MFEDLSLLKNFNGMGRLFPLPNLVLFPFVMQGLHIFESRYRQMTAEALADDRMLAMALLKPGWEGDYEGRPALFPVVCLCRIVADQRLEDGRYNLQVRGLSRARIIEEVDSGKLYRSARVELLPDVPVRAPGLDQKLRRQLVKVVPAWCSAEATMTQMFHKLLKSHLVLGMVCDILSFVLPLSIEAKQELLANPDVESRVRQFLGYLKTHAPSAPLAEFQPKFPPDFSLN
jgi:Lon protease-like protein